MNAPARHIIAALLFVFAAVPVFAQLTEPEVRTRLDAVYAGKADQISRELPALLLRHPGDAGVLYIQAVLTTDGALAANRYQEIADTYPLSVWADDALYKVYQYKYSLGLYKKADETMELLRSRYPRSIYVTGTDSRSVKQDKGAATAAEPPSSPKAAVPAASGTAAAAVTTPSGRVQPAVPAPGVPGKFFVQVGIFSTEANARKAVEQYSGLTGRTAVMTSKTVGDKTQYTVRFEGFDTAEGARAFSAELRSKHNIDSFVLPHSTANPTAR